MIDDPDEQTDSAIAQHIVRVHQKHEEALAPEFTTAQLKRYIAYAKTLKPKVCLYLSTPVICSRLGLKEPEDSCYLQPVIKLCCVLQLSPEARKLLVDSYVDLRRGDTTPGTRVAYRMTVRQLEALIRLSEALARSYLETQVDSVGNFSSLFSHCLS